ncbi:hypothetical protein EJ03DRAFT_88434 [Teratosphaeria nubilosa]|uniref:Uncharacterized protein n=1 Tax=Teratosphaeria nubilosa TaxID=161662 RepID=A0A6G1LAC4_9PEZI|nr:hypothetical protein EJ03DRAFT_88434 [Teratosphaeria nubilosa]
MTMNTKSSRHSVLAANASPFSSPLKPGRRLASSRTTSQFRPEQPTQRSNFRQLPKPHVLRSGRLTAQRHPPVALEPWQPQQRISRLVRRARPR